MDLRASCGSIPPGEAGVVVDPHARHALQRAELITRCGWTPFEGKMVKGRVRTVYLRGLSAYEDGKVLTPRVSVNLSV